MLADLACSISFIQNLTMRMIMKRFTRLTNAHSKEIENLIHRIALHYIYYNFARIHASLRCSPAIGRRCLQETVVYRGYSRSIELNLLAQERGSFLPASARDSRLLLTGIPCHRKRRRFSFFPPLVSCSPTGEWPLSSRRPVVRQTNRMLCLCPPAQKCA